MRATRRPGPAPNGAAADPARRGAEVGLYVECEAEQEKDGLKTAP
jgi:hypothetical protein